MASPIKKIAPVRGLGISGYRVEFSILDLYKLKQLAIECEQKLQQRSELTEMIHNLFEKTVGGTNANWDFLTEEEDAE
jgi:hypothetical protein